MPPFDDRELKLLEAIKMYETSLPAGHTVIIDDDENKSAMVMLLNGEGGEKG